MLVFAGVFLFLSANTDATTTYHVALPGISVPAGATPQVALLHVSDTTATVATPDSTCMVSGENTNNMLLENSCAGLLPSGVEMAQKGIKVTSDNAFDLHVLPMAADGSHWGDGYLAIPDEHLGNEYYIATYCTLGGNCQFSVVGTEDNTAVSVTFQNSISTPATCVNGNPNVPTGTEIPFTLNEDDVLHFESSHDLSGTRIKADKNVAVFAGATGLSFSGGSGYIFEQLPPVTKWMKEHIVIPNELNDAGDIIKVVTMTDNTRLEITGYSPYFLPNKGMAIERRVDWRMFSKVKTSNPVMIVQIMSIDLYNDTTNVGGPPAMVLVQSESQWKTQGKAVCSNTAADTERLLLSVISIEVHTFLLSPPFDNPILRTGPIQDTNIHIIVVNISGTFDSGDVIPDVTARTYGFTSYCLYGNSASAMLASMDWTIDMEECIPTLSTPGDDIDNDCNGQIDEINCTESDLSTVFSSDQKADGSTNQITLGVTLPGYMKFHVMTTFVAEIILWCESDPGIHVVFQISQAQVTGHVSDGESETEPRSSTGPVDEDFWIKWDRPTAGGNVNITIGTGISMSTPLIWFGTTQDCFNKITFHALTGSANFTINAAKDCGKIVPDNVRDNHGKRFVLPVESGHTFTLFTTVTATATPSTFKIVSPDDEDNDLLTDPNTYKAEITQTDINSWNDHLILKSDVPMSAYLVIDGQAGFHLLPTDILGPAYHTVKPHQATAQDKCKVYSIDREINVEHNQAPTVDEFTSQEYTDVDFLEGQQVMPVFCGDFTTSTLQMPPRETLGKKFYIPAVNFTAVSVTSAIIYVVTTEDSTYIKILGDYDQEDIEDAKYTTYDREFVTNERFTIETSKPVMVYVVFQINSMVVPVIIPPVDQYKTSTQFPKFPSYGLSGSFGINADGNEEPTTIVESLLPTESQSLTFTSPTFFLAFLNNGGTVKHIVISDFGLEDINEGCVISLGDTVGVDDDCDGLVDEEQYVTVILAGDIDFDIDGTVNEDTYNGSASYTVTPLTLLNVATEVVDCNAGGTTGGTIPPPTTLVPPTPMPSGAGPIANVSFPQPLVPDEVLPVYDPIENMTMTAATIPMGVDSDPSTSNSTEPIKYCGCVCPCGWVTPTNMTETELKAKVQEIQEKLKLKKTELSAFIRKKTSAKDDRPSATAVGSAGVTFLVITLTAVVLLDLASLVRDLRLLRENLRQAFEM